MGYIDSAKGAVLHVWESFKEKPWYVKAIWVGFLAAVLTLDTLIIVFHNSLLHQLVVASEYWESLGFQGQLAIAAALFIVSFPPISGFSFIVTVAGAIYGIKTGLVVVTLGSTIGSTCSFIVVSKLFRTQAERLVERNHTLKMLTMAVRDSESSYLQEIMSLVLIRVLPLPYSITNGAIACVPDASAICLAAATFISSPKNVLSLFVGRQMRKMGEDESGGRLFDFGVVLIAVCIYGAVSFFLYRRVKQRMEQQEMLQGTDELDFII